MRRSQHHGGAATSRFLAALRSDLALYDTVIQLKLRQVSRARRMRPSAHTRWGTVCLLALTPAADCLTSLPGMQAAAPSAACVEAARAQVDVDLGNRSYPIHIGADLLQDPRLLQRHVSGKRVLIVTNDTIAPLYLDRCNHAPDTRQHTSVAACTHSNPSLRDSAKS